MVKITWKGTGTMDNWRLEKANKIDKDIDFLVSET